MTTEILRNMLYRVDDDGRPSAEDRLKARGGGGGGGGGRGACGGASLLLHRWP